MRYGKNIFINWWIKQYCNKINTSSQKISELWNSVKTTEIAKIRESWMGKDCEAYIVKVEQMDVTMQQAIKHCNYLEQLTNKQLII